ncbi:hypothetical protein [Kribbella aluminosa]|uniref:hypothetical protein n=1 Tax=Kribbella aluminosa TaxID=416017 RepID=UPI0031D5E7C1
MTALQQGWIFCDDGFAWLQRLTPEGLFNPDSMTVDISEVSTVGDLPESWQPYLGADGWYLAVPVRMVNELAAAHGGVTDAQSSYITWQTPVGESDNTQ